MSRSTLKRSCIDVIVADDHLAFVAAIATKERHSNAPIMAPRHSDGQVDDKRLALKTDRKWALDRELRVNFLDGDEGLRKAVFAAAVEWADHANITFVRSEAPDAEVRTTFRVAGYRSAVGLDALTLPPPRYTMSLGGLGPKTPAAEVRRVALHEFGHVLGCIHEHSSPASGIPWDRPAVYAFYEETEGWDKATTDLNIFKRYESSKTQFSDFDPASIMLYPIPAELLTDPDYAVDYNQELSTGDTDFIAKVYPKEAAGTIPLLVGGPAVAVSIEPADELHFKFALGTTARCVIETKGVTETQLALFGPGSPTLRRADDRGSGLGVNARIGEVLDPGEYYVRLAHVRPTGRGDSSIGVSIVP
jgi:hypothetical protein